MFLFSKPDDNTIKAFLESEQDDDFSYKELGKTRNSPPPGFNLDHNRILIGNGESEFEKAKSAIRSWKMFDMPWVELKYTNTPIETGKIVAILVSHLGFYSLNAAKIVYTIDETDRFGFAYGTLTEHGEIGEERFSVEFNSETNEVWYDLYAFSRPGQLLAKIGYPISRYYQKKFARDSKQAMADAVAEAF